MNQYVTGNMIKELREKNNLTQNDLADKLSVSVKTISKWENGRGYPDIEMLEPIAKTFNISLLELFEGKEIINKNVSANMLKSNFYVCPICGNIIYSVGESTMSCHGLNLYPLEKEESCEVHDIKVQKIENQYYVSIEHEMSKSHYISFIAALSSDRVQLVKLYPEQSAEAYFVINGVRKIVCYCNKDGLFETIIKK